MTIKYFLSIEQIIHSIRDFFYSRGFHEIIVPILNPSLPLEPNIYAFKVGKYFLPTSPEATLKKAIAKGIGNCFAVGHTFRDLEGTSSIHKPEFLMLEWYREGASYKEIMRECEELILYCSSKVENYYGLNFSTLVYPEQKSRDSKNKWSILSMEELFRKYAKLNLEKLCHAELVSASNSHHKGIPPRAKQCRDDIFSRIKRGYTTQNVTWEQVFNQIFLNEIEKHLPKEPFFLTDYPARISPLCAKRADKPYLAERFELFIDQIEIANGNTENTNSAEVLTVMKKEEQYRKKVGILSPPIDMEFIEALKKMQGKSYAGVGLGVERLAMVLGGVKDIQDLR